LVVPPREVHGGEVGKEAEINACYARSGHQIFIYNRIPKHSSLFQSILRLRNDLAAGVSLLLGIFFFQFYAL
jgi:hypothetical protein